MTVRIVIDPNVRVRDNQTYAGFEDVSPPGAALAAGDRLFAVETEDGIVTDATVTEVDQEKQLVYLLPDWRGWRDDPEAADDPHCE